MKIVQIYYSNYVELEVPEGLTEEEVELYIMEKVPAIGSAHEWEIIEEEN